MQALFASQNQTIGLKLNLSLANEISENDNDERDGHMEMSTPLASFKKHVVQQKVSPNSVARGTSGPCSPAMAKHKTAKTVCGVPLSCVAESDSFPAPMIHRASMNDVHIMVDVETKAFEVKKCLVTKSGHTYEMHKTIKHAIFGSVVKAILLSQVGPDLFRRTSSEMAIKVYSKKLLAEYRGKTEENPLTEISALQFLGDKQSNIMGQIECCTDADNIYSVMRFSRGSELFEFIQDRGAMSENSAKNMFTELVRGVNYLWQRGVGHADLSCENILYDARAAKMSSDDVKKENASTIIIDFGMCVRLKQNPLFDPVAPADLGRDDVFVDSNAFCHISKHERMPCGKKNYIAPEVLRGDAYLNPLLCDVWALGIILFIALTGVPPMDTASSDDDRFNLICDGRLGDLVEAWGLDLSEEAVDLVQRLLREDPQERLSLKEIMSHPFITGQQMRQ